MRMILVAADTKSMTPVIRSCFDPRDWLVLEAETVQEVLDRFVDSNGRIEWMLIDADHFPPTAALDMALKLRNWFPRLRVLIWSRGFDLPFAGKQASILRRLPAGTISFLRSPFTLRELRQRFEQPDRETYSVA